MSCVSWPVCVTLVRALGNFLSKSIQVLCVSKNAFKPCWSEVIPIKNEIWSFALFRVSLFEIPGAEVVLVWILRLAGRAQRLGVVVATTVVGEGCGAIFSFSPFHQLRWSSSFSGIEGPPRLKKRKELGWSHRPCEQGRACLVWAGRPFLKSQVDTSH